MLGARDSCARVILQAGFSVTVTPGARDLVTVTPVPWTPVPVTPGDRAQLLPGPRAPSSCLWPLQAELECQPEELQPCYRPTFHLCQKDEKYVY